MCYKQKHERTHKQKLQSQSGMQSPKRAHVRTQTRVRAHILSHACACNHLTLILYKVLDKSISANGNTKTYLTVNYKGRGRGQGTEVRKGAPAR